MSRPAAASLYVHIPFCRSICRYCDFSRQLHTPDSEKRYLSALIAELESVIPDGLPVETVFFGGGTPSALSVSSWRRLFNALNERLDFSNLTEMTAEANPESYTDEIATVWRDAGVTRLSFGAQSFNDRLLKIIGRIHTAEDVETAVQRARQSGIARVSVDLIYGLPSQTLVDWRADMRCAARLPVEHLSAYALTIESQSVWGMESARAGLAFPDDERVSDMYRAAMDELPLLGFEQYEISNWRAAGARKKTGAPTECLHNMKYWRREPVYALGPAASGFDGQTRWTNRRRFEDWADAIEKGGSPVAETETLEPDRALGEAIMLALRLNEGADLKALRRLFGTRASKERFVAIEKQIAVFESQGLIARDGDVVRLTSIARPVADAVLCDLI